MGATPETNAALQSAKTRFAGDVLSNIGSSGSYSTAPGYLEGAKLFTPPKYTDDTGDKSTADSSPTNKSKSTVDSSSTTKKNYYTY